MATSLILIAHASTEASRRGDFPTDAPLDAFGERDCARAEGCVAAERVLVAPELRARQTAERLGLTGGAEAALRDADYGDWAGKPLDGVSGEALLGWLADPESAPHGGESFGAVLRRAGDWMDRQKVVPGRIVAVTHPVILRAAIAHALAAGAAAFQAIDIAPLDAATFSFSNRWRLCSLAPLVERAG